MTEQRENRYARARHEAAGRSDFLDLIDTNFHSCGFRYPRDVVWKLIEEHLSLSPNYDPDPAGDPGLRDAVASFYSAAGAAVTQSDVVVTASASESYSHIFASQCRHGEHILLPRPGYPIFEDIAARAGLEVDFYDQRRDANWSVDPEQIESLIKPRSRALVLISPNNPTGAVVNETVIREVGEICMRHAMFIVSDEVFSDFVFSGAGVRSQSGDNRPAAMPQRSVLPRPLILVPEVTTFTINGASKLFASPELKVSWVVVSGRRRERQRATEDLLLRNDLFLSTAPCNQAVAAGLLNRGMEFTRLMVNQISERRACMLHEVGMTPGLSAIPPAGGIHLPVTIDPAHLPADHDDEDLAVDLLHNGVASHPGYLYGMDDPPALVLSYLAPQQRIREGFERIRACLGRY